MKICVTGGAGFIGSNFLHYMVKKYTDWEFVCIDSLTYASTLASLHCLSDNPTFIFNKADITDKDEIDRLFNYHKFDMVVNFAAETHVDNSIKNPNIFVHTNIFGTQILLEACRKYKVKRFHQISTDEVYGDLPLNSDLKFTEDTHINPSSPYSASKASADLLVMSYFRTFDLPVTISRCSNNYGPYQHKEKLIPLIIDKVKHDQSIPVYGVGCNVRDWIHVHDHNIAVERILVDGKVGEVYNIGANTEKTNLEVVKIILKIMNKPESLITFVTDRAGHDLRYAVDNSKLNSELSWNPLYTFEQGITETIDWYCK